MESVEELCEYITLIHNAEKILDGKLTEIKKAYKNNIFNVGLQVDNAEALINELRASHTITGSSYNQLEKQLNFKVQLPSEDTREFLQYISSRGSVYNFIETIPSASDIFIQTVQSKNFHE